MRSQIKSVLGGFLLTVPLAISIAAQPDQFGADVPRTTTSYVHDVVFDRLLALLAEIPKRWQGLPVPRIPMTGKGPNEVRASSTAMEQEIAGKWFLELVRNPFESREAWIASLLERHHLKEIDLWLPTWLISCTQLHDPPEAARMLEAWLMLSESLGRQDTLLWAVGDAFNLIVSHRTARDLAPLLPAWSKVTAGVEASHGMAWMNRNLGHAFFFLGNNKEALEAYDKARRLFESVGDVFNQANAWIGIAQVQLHVGKMPEALAGYRHSRWLYEPTEFQSQANTWRGEAQALFHMGDNEGTLAALQRARELFTFAGDQNGVANTFFEEAQVIFRQGENARSLATYRHSRELYQGAKMPHGEASTWTGEAQVLLYVGDSSGALDAYRKAWKLFADFGDPQGQAEALAGQGGVLLIRGHNDSALAAYEKAREQLEAVDSLLGQGNTWTDEADVLLRMGQDQKALSAYRHARQLFEASNSEVGRTNSWCGEAEVHLSSGRAADAARAAGRCYELAKPLDAGGAEVRALVIEAAARHELAEIDQVVELTERAIERFTTWRDGFVTDVQRTAKENRIRPAYDLLILSLWQLGRPTAALVRAEQARSRVLLDLVASRDAGHVGDSGSSSDLERRKKALTSELAAIERSLATATTLLEHQELKSQRALSDEELERLRFESVLSGGLPLASSTAVDLAGLRTTVNETGPTLLFHAASSELLAFLLLPGVDEPVAKRFELSHEELTAQVQELAKGLANPSYRHLAEAPARKLWQELFEPFAEQLPSRGPLTLVPHGPLHKLAFEALIDAEGQTLFERYDVSVTPSISTLHHVRAHHRPARRDDRLVAFAAGEGLSLPVAEAQAVAELFDRTALELTAPDFEAYVDEASTARQLLIASVGTLSPGNRRQTYLEIQPSETHDSRLSAAEIATIPIDAELVTLAACDTAAAEALLSDERLDLTRAFLIAGTASVLATRWKVPEDYRTSQFLVDFYRLYRQGPDGRGMRKDRALTEARKLSRKRGDPAQIWAAWVLVGDAR